MLQQRGASIRRPASGHPDRCSVTGPLAVANCSRHRTRPPASHERARPSVALASSLSLSLSLSVAPCFSTHLRVLGHGVILLGHDDSLCQRGAAASDIRRAAAAAAEREQSTAGRRQRQRTDARISHRAATTRNPMSTRSHAGRAETQCNNSPGRARRRPQPAQPAASDRSSRLALADP